MDHLAEDLSLAQRADLQDVVSQHFTGSENPLVSLAAATIYAHAAGLASLGRSDLEWAANTVLTAGENAVIDDLAYSDSMFSMGADRAAAASVPMLLLDPFAGLGLDQKRIEGCLLLLGTSYFDEVRAHLVNGAQAVWSASCVGLVGETMCRRHAPVWAAARAGLVDSRLGPWDTYGQRRESIPLSEPIQRALIGMVDSEILINRLRMPLACMIDARNVVCLRDSIGELWVPLWDAHRRGLVAAWGKGYDHLAHITHRPMARRMIEVSFDGGRDIVESHIRSCAADSNALHLLFDGFASVFTYDEALRERMAEFWPWAMEIALDAVGDGAELRSQGRFYDYMVAALLPTPTPESEDADIDGTLAMCRISWISPGVLGDLPDRWLKLAAGQAKAVEAVVSYARGASLDWQVRVPLGWIETIIDGRFDAMANQLWLLEEWLVELRASGAMGGGVEGIYHRIVDGLAAAGDYSAVRLQRLDE